MAGRVTMRDVARAAGVSPMTVSRALKPGGLVNARTARTVREAASRLGYVYDATAQAFRAQRSGFLAVTLPSTNNANFAATHRGLTRALEGTDLQILLGITDYQVEEEERLVRQLLARRPEAIVLTGGTHTEATRGLLSSVDIPVIEIWDVPEAALGHVVGFSNQRAMWPIVEHLAAAGRRRLAFLGATGVTDARGAERWAGVVAAARALGLPEVVRLDAGPAPASMREGAWAIDGARDCLGAFDALVCVSDPVAFGAITACVRLGIDVPGDLAVTGFGAFEIGEMSRPRITTVDVGALRIGMETGRLLRDLEGDDAGAVRVDTGARLVVGGSS